MFSHVCPLVVPLAEGSRREYSPGALWIINRNICHRGGVLFITNQKICVCNMLTLCRAVAIRTGGTGARQSEGALRIERREDRTFNAFVCVVPPKSRWRFFAIGTLHLYLSLSLSLSVCVCVQCFV